MKVAFISYELPPDTALGGIGTYVHQAARMLSWRGHHVEVIAGSLDWLGTRHQDGYEVHRVAGDRDAFRLSAGRAFAERHASVGFDVLEGPDYTAEAFEAVRLVPDIPLVVKLHTPVDLLRRIDLAAMSRYRKFRIQFGAFRRGLPSPWTPGQIERMERQHTLDADEIAAPSRAIVDKLQEPWGLEPERISVYPHPFEPSESLTSIRPEAPGQFVTFIGRLTVRKGVAELATAIPRIARAVPEARFRFVGRDLPSGCAGRMMSHTLRDMMGRAASRAEILSHVPSQCLPGILGEASVCVFPSHWESFSFVCLEAMSAGRAVVGSTAGGMAELLELGRCGVLVPPLRPRAIAATVIRLLRDPDRCRSLGELARQRAVECHSGDRIGPFQEASYGRAIARRRLAGRRRPA
jgi:glycosyltransferase involved in cell wall biosynthesis